MKKLFPILLLLITIFSTGVTAQNPSVSYQGHVENIGWQDYVTDGATAGTTGQALRVEAVRIKLLNAPEGSGIEYSPHVEDYGWRDYVSNDDIGGTTGECKRVEAFKIRLTGPISQTHDVYYRTHVADFSWLGWAKNDEVAGTSGYAKRMEGIQIVIVPKGSNPPGPTGCHSIEKEKIDAGETGLDANTGIEYTVAVQNLGWQAPLTNGGEAGVPDQGVTIEQINVELKNLDGGVEYNTYIQNEAWQPTASNGQDSGKPGLHIESLNMNLTGEARYQYDIYYRTKVAKVGWLEWACNGQTAGSSDGNCGIEALDIRLVPKGQLAPGLTGIYFFKIARAPNGNMAIPGVRTLQNFLKLATLPVGTTNYVWGGGWNEADDAAGPAAVHIGLYPRWQEFFSQQDASYNYNNTRYQILDGLDCSGYVGWVVYNTLNNQDNGPGEVYWADDQAEWFASKNYGFFTPANSLSNYQPGDIVSLPSGHVYICLGTCADGSVLLAHSSPPGVMLTGTVGGTGQNSQARELAHTYMSKYYPEYYQRYSNQLDRNAHDYLSNTGKFTWAPNVVIDPDGMRDKSPEEVLRILFNE